MTNDLSDLTPTIVPKSDQLNAEQLLAGPITIKVTDVRIGSGDEQPVIVHYEGENGRPYKPCKTMRKLLILAWGKDGRQWPGKSMTLFNEPTVKFGSMEVGGIRISHLSHIDRDLQVALTATKGKKVLHTVKKLRVAEAAQVDHDAAINAADTAGKLRAAFGAAYKSTADAGQRDKYKAAYDARMKQITNEGAAQ